VENSTIKNSTLQNPAFSSLPLFPLEHEQQLTQLEGQLEIEEEQNNLVSEIYLSLKLQHKSYIQQIYVNYVL
jgi:hypothetical protein